MLVELDCIKLALAPGQRLLGMDFGSHTLGIAISDPALRVASPLITLKRKKFSQDLPHIQHILYNYNIGAIILGWPLNMNGTPSKRCQATKQFALNMAYHGVNLPMTFFDERLSTVAIDKILIKEADMSRAKRKQAVDKMAAGFILQGALEYLENENL